MIRVARRAAATLLLAFALTSLVGTAALAASPRTAAPSPSPSPVSKVVSYTGTGITTNPSNPQFAQGADTLPTTATIDCTATPCTILVVVTDTSNGNSQVSLSGGTPIALVRGSADVRVTGPSDAVCFDGVTPSGRFGATARGDSLTVTFAFDPVAQQNCPDGSTVATADGYIFTGTLTTTSGAGCVVDGSCPTPTPTPSATAAAVSASGSRSAIVTPHAVRIADPSVLSTLPVAATGLTPANILWAAAATVVLVLLIALPSHLLNSATEAGTDRVSAWWTKTRKRVRLAAAAAAPATDGLATDGLATTAATPTTPVNFAGWPLAAAGVLAASLISSFVDPGFGFNAASIRVFLSILLSFLLDAVLGWFLLILLVRRANPKATATFHFTPASLLIVVIAVLFTRLTGFAPGIVFGLVAGVAFGAIVATAEKARLAMVSLGYSFVLAIIGWAGYSAIADSVGAHPAAPVVFVQETLSSMAIGGIAALPIVLIPLRGMAGFEIFRWNRWIWASAYAIGLLSFFVVLMPKPFSWATVGLSIWTWAGIYVAYAVVAVVLWLVITRPWKKGDDETSTATDVPVSADLAHVQSPDAAAGA